jgi:hypothetical protein
MNKPFVVIIGVAAVTIMVVAATIYFQARISPTDEYGASQRPRQVVTANSTSLVRKTLSTSSAPIQAVPYPAPLDVYPKITIAKLSALPKSGRTPLAVGFYFVSPNFNPSHDSIDFGDGSPYGSDWALSEGPAFQEHVYEAPGNYVAVVFELGSPVATTTIFVTSSTTSRNNQEIGR